MRRIASSTPTATCLIVSVVLGLHSMRFGGHQTFFVREGWLAKGLGLLREDVSAFDDPYVADRLGVGRNMAKSIEHWLLATGLAQKTERRAVALPGNRD